jgi:nucleotide-binding universal stress UspA family protein
MLKHILVPLDGSQVAERALDYAQNLLSATTRITLLMAIDPPDVIPYGTYGGSPDGGLIESRIDYQKLADDMYSQGSAYLERIASDLKGRGLHVAWKTEIGAAVDVIVEAARAEQVDTIVMSTHGRSGLTRWLLGSVTQKVLAAAPCPVYVIPPSID